VFTGIVEETGRLGRIEHRSGGVRMEIEALAVLDGTGPGHSISVNGVCLTVEKVTAGRFSAFLSRETTEKTTFREARPGDPVNLERALAFGGRLGGHLVSGHVEAVGRIEALDVEGEAYSLAVSVPPAFSQYLVPKGSIAIDGVSLTIVDVIQRNLTVALIPETFEKTTFRLKTPGDFVNLEPDMIIKYVMSAVRQIVNPEEGDSFTMEKLRKSGFIAD
jgi:riboflavin synthase